MWTNNLINVPSCKNGNYLQHESVVKENTDINATNSIFLFVKCKSKLVI